MNGNMPNQRTDPSPAVQAIVESYIDLILAQCDAPDWPYQGMNYAASESAADERWKFWRDVERWADDEDIADAKQELFGFRD